MHVMGGFLTPLDSREWGSRSFRIADCLLLMLTSEEVRQDSVKVHFRPVRSRRCYHSGDRVRGGVRRDRSTLHAIPGCIAAV